MQGINLISYKEVSGLLLTTDCLSPDKLGVPPCKFLNFVRRPSMYFCLLVNQTNQKSRFIVIICRLPY